MRWRIKQAEDRRLKVEGAKNFLPPCALRLPPSRFGFTLIEVIIVTAMVSVISMALYGTLSNGLRIWKKVQGVLPEEDINIYLSRMDADFRNTFSSPRMPFVGTADRVEFPTLVVMEGTRSRTAGKVVYSFDSYSRVLNRVQMDYSQLYRDVQNLPSRSLKSVRHTAIRYYFYDTQKKEFVWGQEWQQGLPPLAVQVEIELDGDLGHITRTIGIPSAAKPAVEG